MLTRALLAGLLQGLCLTVLWNLRVQGNPNVVTHNVIGNHRYVCVSRSTSCRSEIRVAGNTMST